MTPGVKLEGLTLAKHVEVITGVKLGQEVEPPARQILLVHHLGGEQAAVKGLQLGQVDGAIVAGVEW